MGRYFTAARTGLTGNRCSVWYGSVQHEQTIKHLCQHKAAREDHVIIGGGEQVIRERRGQPSDRVTLTAPEEGRVTGRITAACSVTRHVRRRRPSAARHVTSIIQPAKVGLMCGRPRSRR